MIKVCSVNLTRRRDESFYSFHSLTTTTTKGQEKQEIMDTMYDAAAEVLSSGRLTEFVDPPSVLRLQASQEKRQRLQASQEKRQRSAMLVVKGMGDWKRYGLQPLRVSNQQEGDTVASLTYTTLKGGHFDGQLTVKVERTKNDTLVVQIRLGIPKKGRKV